MSAGKVIGTIILIIVLLFFALIGYVIYRVVSFGISIKDCITDPLSCLVGAKVDTDCDKYGDGKPIGDPQGPSCSDINTELYAGLCYKKCPVGFKRTAACTCSNMDLQTDCNKFGDGKPIGDKDGPGCPPGMELYAGLCYKKCPDGYHRTAVCTCEKGSTETDCNKYGLAGSPQPTCPPGTEYYGGLCYKADYDKRYWTRTAACTLCKGNKDCWWVGNLWTDCDKFGVHGTPDYKCPEGTELYGGLCYKKCPAGKTRTAACTCSDYDLKTDCGSFGSSGTPSVCPPDRELYGGMCYKKCPDGYKRTATCSCQKGETTETNCDKYGSIGAPNSCPPSREIYGSMCYKQCPPGTKRIAPCSCQHIKN